jgi:hypothetical protein
VSRRGRGPFAHWPNLSPSTGSGILDALGSFMRLSSVTVLVSTVLLAAPVAAQEGAGRARVDGRVRDEHGAPLAGATVSARHLARHAGLQVRSDAQGRFVIDGLASGSWMMEIMAPGYPVRRIGVHLPSESSWLDLFDVRLEKTRPEPPPSSPGSAGVVAGGTDSPAHYEDVRAALVDGRVDRARRLLSSVDANAPGDVDVLFEIGQGLLTAGETEEAVTFFGRALDRDPGHAEAHYRRALGLLALGRSEEARHDFEAVVALRPDSDVADKAGLALEQLAPARRDSAVPSRPSPVPPGTGE